MFERFTKEARAVVAGAQQVARGTGSRSVDTRHLLVALVESPGPAQRALLDTGADIATVAVKARADVRAGGLDADALAGIGIDLDAVRRQADAVFGPEALERAVRKQPRHVPFSPDAKKALKLALRETIRLQHRNIHDGHLLLGVLRAQSPGRTLLLDAGVDTDALRAALERHTTAA